MDDLGREIGLGLLRFALPGDVFEPERDRGSGVALDLHDLVDAIRPSFDVDVEGAIGVSVEKEALQPSGLAGDGPRRLREPILGVAAKGGLEGVVSPLNRALLVDQGDRSLEVFGDDVFVVQVHCGTVMARSFWSLARLNNVVNASNGLRIRSFCRSRRPSMSEMRYPSWAVRLNRAKFDRNSAVSLGTACMAFGWARKSRTIVVRRISV